MNTQLNRVVEARRQKRLEEKFTCIGCGKKDNFCFYLDCREQDDNMACPMCYDAMYLRNQYLLKIESITDELLGSLDDIFNDGNTNQESNNQTSFMFRRDTITIETKRMENK